MKSMLGLCLLLAVSSAFAGKELDVIDCVPSKALTVIIANDKEYKNVTKLGIRQNYNKNYGKLFPNGKESTQSQPYSRGNAGVISIGDFTDFAVTLRPIKESGLLESRNKAKAYKKYNGKFHDTRTNEVVPLSCTLKLVYEK